MSEKPDLLDLSAHARLGRLSDTERQAFEQALAADAALRTAHALGRDFDLLSRVRSGDEALVERAAAGALGGLRARKPRRFSRLALLLAAAFAIASAAAAARNLVLGRSEPPAAASAVRPAAPVAQKAAPHPNARVAPPRGESQLTAPPVPSGNPLAAVLAPRSAVASSPPAPDAAENTAAALFRRAGAARRAGDFEAARALYVELQTAFPDSSEARVSRVSLGKLYLAGGRARDAEREFSKYLRAGAADLREEALVGRADALFALGQSAEERNVWQELIVRHKTSVYAARARQRIDAIDGRAPDLAR
jgi:TolA-binding protein